MMVGACRASSSWISSFIVRAGVGFSAGSGAGAWASALDTVRISLGSSFTSLRVRRTGAGWHRTTRSGRRQSESDCRREEEQAFDR
jgi:hypothetical protein